MRCIIIDDELHCIGSLEILLEKHFTDIKVLATCQNGQEGLLAIDNYSPDLIFLDISMPKMNGFEMLSKIKQPTFKTIFTTAFDNFAIKAFKVSAIDYLLKPVDKTELSDAIDKARKSMSSDITMQSSIDHVKLFLENVNTNKASFPNIAIPTLSGLQMVKVENILYVESDSNYSIFYFLDGSKQTITRTLKDVEEQLESYRFSRIHRSSLINLLHLKEYIKGEGGYVILNNGKHLDVSRRKKESLINQLRKL